MEDALKRLDALTQEEARMAIAENLRATHTVDERVRGVTELVLAVDDRVAGVDDRLANVNDRVAGINDRVAGVGDRVAGVDDRLAIVDDRVTNVISKVTEIIRGACKSSSALSSVSPEMLRWEGCKASYQTSGQQCRSSKTFVVSTSSALSIEPYPSFQKINCVRTSIDGSPRQIRRSTIILPVILITRKLQNGSSTETFTKNGNQKDPCFGFMESVCSLPIFHTVPSNDIPIL